jgi:formylglycine-generating enzyme required for sulfatase activity
MGYGRAVVFASIGCLMLRAASGWVAADAPDAKEIATSVGIKLVLMPKGQFMMGSEELPSEKPIHPVRITKPFYMAIHPVTVGQFRAFVKDTQYKSGPEAGKGGDGFDTTTGWLAMKPEFTWLKPGFEQADDHPVVLVNWNDATEFCKWLSKKEGKTFRLPTEAEWEYACRAGTTTRYSCGDADESLKGHANLADASLKPKIDPNRVATFNLAPKGNTSGGFAGFDDGYVFTSPVGKFKPNPWGLYDMHGNVWQWCSDFSGKYPEGAQDDPVGAAQGKGRNIRGGTWFMGPLRCRSANRVQRDPSYSACFIGFRVVCGKD